MKAIFLKYFHWREAKNIGLSYGRKRWSSEPDSSVSSLLMDVFDSFFFSKFLQ